MSTIRSCPGCGGPLYHQGHTSSRFRESCQNPTCTGTPRGAVKTLAATMIPIEPEPSDLRDAPAEYCCFCHLPTRWWTALPDRTPAGQVACCTQCAAKHQPAEVPTKATWCGDASAESLWRMP